MAVTWPITKTGTYASGSVASASDFSTDFTTLYDAVNQVHNRFSTFVFTAHYQRFCDNDAGFTSRGESSEGDSPSLVKIFKVPDWMQGIRVRKFSVACMSNPPSSGSQVLSNDGDGSLKFKLDRATAITAFNINTYVSAKQWTAQNIATLDFTVSGANGSATQDPLLGITANSGYPTIIEANVTSNNVFVPGDYVAIYFIGGFTGTVNQTFTHRFDISVQCDAMVPVP